MKRNTVEVIIVILLALIVLTPLIYFLVIEMLDFLPKVWEDMIQDIARRFF